MSRDAPWFKFYAADWIADPEIRYMTPEQRGYLIQLRCEAWQSHPAGTLPADPEKVWQLAGAPTRKRFEKVSARVLAQFELREGRYICAELTDQHEALVATQQLRTRAGQVGAHARWGSRKDMRNALPNALPNANQPESNRIAYKNRIDKEEERSDSGAPGTKKWEMDQKLIAWNQDQERMMGRGRK